MTRITPLLERNEQFARTYAPAPLGPPLRRCSSSAASTTESTPRSSWECGSARLPWGRVTPAVIDDISYLAFLAEQLFSGQVAADEFFEVAVVHHTQCGTGFLANPRFRHQAAEVTGIPEAALEASAVGDPHATVEADVERLLTAPSLSPKVSVSGHVYDIATGRLTTTLDARYPQPAGSISAPQN
jgi:carbonic anhydrase